MNRLPLRPVQVNVETGHSSLSSSSKISYVTSGKSLASQPSKTRELGGFNDENARTVSAKLEIGGQQKEPLKSDPDKKAVSSSTDSTTDDQHEVEIEELRRSPDGNGYTVHHYIRGKLLGKGGFAKVYLCTSLDNNRSYAVKIVPKANLVKARARQKVWNLYVIRRFVEIFESSLTVMPCFFSTISPATS